MSASSRPFTEAIRARHLLRPIPIARADEPLAELRCWMDALGLSAVPVEGAPARVLRPSAAQGPGTAAQAAEPAAPLLPADAPLHMVLPLLSAEPYVALVDEEQIAGLLTPDDLDHPALGHWVLAHLLALPAALDQLLASYDPSREAKGPPSPWRTFEDTAACAALRADLGLPDPASARARLHPLQHSRAHLLHGRPLREGAANPDEAVRHALDAVLLCRRAWALLDDRPQLWEAYLAAHIRTDRGPLTGPDALALPRPLTILTAANPQSEPRSEAENAHRNARLHALLTLRGLEPEPSLTSAPDGSWPEPGFAVSLEVPEALALARRFAQRAIYHLTDATLQVIDAHGTVRRTRPRRA